MVVPYSSFLANSLSYKQIQPGSVWAIVGFFTMVAELILQARGVSPLSGSRNASASHQTIVKRYVQALFK